MGYLIYFSVIFIVVFLFYFLLLNRIKLKKKDFNKIGEINYLIKKFKLDPKKVDYNVTANVIALINAFIIAFTCVAISIVEMKLMWQLLIGFVLLFALIYSIYEIYGRVLIKKGWGKNV